MWVGNYPQEDLANFGYTSKRTVQILFSILAMVWLHATDLSKYGNFKWLFPHNMRTLGQHFLPRKKSLCTLLQGHLSCHQVVKFCPQKNHRSDDVRGTLRTL